MKPANSSSVRSKAGIRDEASRRVREMEKEVEATAGPRARKILATAIQRYTSEVTAENTVSVVQIPVTAWKGRIIGREGRNIRAIEVRDRRRPHHR